MSTEDDDRVRNSDLPTKFVRGAAPPVVGALASAAIAGVITGSTGTVVGNVVAALVPEAANTIAEYQRRAGMSAEQMLTSACDQAGISPADLHLWAVHDSARLSVLANTVQAAISSLNETKINALARVLAEAVEDDAQLDIAALMTSALADLEAPHIRVLRAFCRETAPLTTAEPTGPGVWLQSGLEQRFPNLKGGILSIIAALSRHGLVAEGLAGTRADGKADRAWFVTEYGSALHAYLQDGVKSAGPTLPRE